MSGQDPAATRRLAWTGLGPLGLHGGAEYQPGDEPFGRLLLEAAAVPARGRAAACLPGSDVDPAAIRVVLLPTAAARQRPERAAEHGAAYFERLGRETGTELRLEIAAIVDEATAASPRLAARLAGADLIHMPGGDPDLIPALLPGTLAWQAILGARARGAVLAGASAGAMALAGWCWTPDGFVPGLGLLPRLVVAPHFAGAGGERWLARLRSGLPDGIGILGLAERTGILAAGTLGGNLRRWRVAGQGAAAWYPPGAREAARATAGPWLELPT